MQRGPVPRLGENCYSCAMTRDGHDNAGQPAAAPAARTIDQGQDWCVREYVCTAGPDDRPFEERHDHVTIAAVVDGLFKYRAATGTALLHPGAFLLGNPGTCYECGHDHSTGDRCVAFHISPAYFAEVAASRTGSDRFGFPMAMLPAIPQLLPWFAWIEARAAAAEHLERDDAIRQLLAAVIDAASDTKPTPVRLAARDERRISDALRYIELNAAEPLDLDTLAAVAVMSKYHFLRTFRHLVGMTPYKYLLRFRLRRAAARLATSAEPVSSIAFEAGFGDLSTFNGMFRGTFGVSPTTWRTREASR
jgi:AraC family transcriptional regulator